jgi:hypothetical protein
MSPSFALVPGRAMSAAAAGPPSTSSHIPPPYLRHSATLVPAARAAANELDAVRLKRGGATLGIGGPKREDVMAEAAALFLRCGDLQRWCDLQCELGHWELAMAVAPGVSVDYWRSLVQKYVDRARVESQSADVAPYLAATGNVPALVQLLQSRGETMGAMLAAQADAEGCFDGVRAANSA